MRAVNEAGVSAFITRPWDDGRLRSVVGEVLERHLREQERHHLELRIVVQNHALEALNDDFEKRIAERTEQLKAEHARLESAYSDLLESHRTTVNLLANVIALHRIGLMGIDNHALHQPSASLRGEELTKVHRHPFMAEALLMGIPHLQRVAEVLRSEHERFDGLGFLDRIGSAEIPLGSRILAVARDFHDLIAGRLVTKHYMSADALTFMLEGSGHHYDPAVVDAFKRVHKDATHLDTTIEEAMQRSATLEPGMCLSRDLMTPQGLLLLNKNQVLTVIRDQQDQKARTDYWPSP